MSTLSVNAITDSNGGSTATINGHTPTVSNMAGRNRIINGAMMIDQRNAGASGTSTAYTVDRWTYGATQASKITWQQNAGSVTPPTGFTNYLGFTTTTAYTITSTDIFQILQNIEGLNVPDLGWGTAGAATVTLSFWVRSSLTGTFGGSVSNSALNRSYPFSFTISSANTWEYKTVIIPGDTTGTWLTTNGVGVRVFFSFGMGSTYSGTAGSWAGADYRSATGATSVVGTSGATFYITGVQLEKGSTATSFDYRPYGTELRLCQRYYSQTTSSSVGLLGASKQYIGYYALPVSMRVVPSVAQSGTVTVYGVNFADFNTSTPTLQNGFGVGGGAIVFTGANTTGGSLGLGAWLYGSGVLQFSSEL